MENKPERSPIRYLTRYLTRYLETAAVTGVCLTVAAGAQYLGIDVRQSLMYGVSTGVTAMGLLFDRVGRRYEPNPLFKIPGQSIEPKHESYLRRRGTYITAGLGSALGLAMSGNWESWVLGGISAPLVVEQIRRRI